METKIDLAEEDDNVETNVTKIRQKKPAISRKNAASQAGSPVISLNNSSAMVLRLRFHNSSAMVLIEVLDV